MAHPHELVVRGAHEALDRDDMAGFAAAFAPSVPSSLPASRPKA